MRCFRRWRWPIVSLEPLSLARRHALAERALRRPTLDILSLAALLNASAAAAGSQMPTQGSFILNYYSYSKQEDFLKRWGDIVKRRRDIVKRDILNSQIQLSKCNVYIKLPFVDIAMSAMFTMSTMSTMSTSVDLFYRSLLQVSFYILRALLHVYLSLQVYIQETKGIPFVDKRQLYKHIVNRKTFSKDGETLSNDGETLSKEAFFIVIFAALLDAFAAACKRAL